MSEENINENIEMKNNQTLKQKPLFTQAEIAQQVRDFIHAYRIGRIKLKPKKNDSEQEPLTSGRLSDVLLNNYKHEEKRVNSKYEYVRTKNELHDLISICEGSKTATDEERYKKMLELFNRILTLQSDERLEGTIESYDLKQRVEELETKVSGLVSRMDVFGDNSV